MFHCVNPGVRIMETRINTANDKKLPIIREVIDIIINSTRLFKIIQIIPSSGNNQIVIFDDEPNNTLDIGITKQAYLSMFKQCHDYWYSYIDDEASSLAELNVAQLEELYLATLGYLVTANDHHSIMNLHEDIVRYLCNYETDIEIISCFLTSHLKRINKSSLLWNWMKKLTVQQIYKPLFDEASKDLDGNDLYRTMILRTFRSCKNHYMNYYANNFIHWIMAINYHVLGFGDVNVLYKELQNQCHDNLLDSSLWINLRNYICCLKGSIDTEFVVEEFERICSSYEIAVPKKVQPKISTINPDDLIVNEVKWLIKVDCKYKSPFQLLLSTTQETSTLGTLKKLISSREDLKGLIDSET